MDVCRYHKDLCENEGGKSIFPKKEPSISATATCKRMSSSAHVCYGPIMCHLNSTFIQKSAAILKCFNLTFLSSNVSFRTANIAKGIFDDILLPV
jgi:hypothetical protein